MARVVDHITELVTTFSVRDTERGEHFHPKRIVTNSGLTPTPAELQALLDEHRDKFVSTRAALRAAHNAE